MRHFKLGFFLLFFSVSNSVFGQAPSPVPAQIRAQISQHFTKSLPTLKIDYIESTPIDQLYQVVCGPVVMYATADGHYAISGDILNLQDGKTNLTDSRREKALVQALDQLGEGNMVVYAPPTSIKPRYTVTVFTDLECLYCQKLHADIEKINQLGVKVRYVAFPKAGRDTPGYDKLVSVWCAIDRKKAFNEAMVGKTGSLKCPNHQVDKQFHLGALSGVSGTPTFVIEGKLVPGYSDPENLLGVLKQVTAEARPSIS